MKLLLALVAAVALATPAAAQTPRAFGQPLARAADGGARADVVLSMLVIGGGLGFMSTPYLVSVQTGVPWRRRGVATSSQQFFRPIQLVSQFYAQAQSSLAGAERIYLELDDMTTGTRTAEGLTVRLKGSDAVVVLIPPAVPPGFPPMNMNTRHSVSVAEPMALNSTELNPAVRSVTA